LWFSLLLAVFAVSGCGGNSDGATDGAQSQGAGTSAAVADSSARLPIASITFIGLKEACPCTRNRIDESWRVLQNTLALVPDLPVVRLQRDVDKEASLQLIRQHSLLVAPGLYFLDAERRIVELLQGEVTEKQILDLLQGEGS